MRVNDINWLHGLSYETPQNLEGGEMVIAAAVPPQITHFAHIF
jgi:hypothetical protein